MYCLVYYKINDRERYNLQRVSVRPPFNDFSFFALYEMSEWHWGHLLTYQVMTEYAKDKDKNKEIKRPMIQDCGYHYPSKERNYMVMGTFKHNGKWSEYSHACSRFCTKEEAEETLKEQLNPKRKDLFETKYKIKQYSYKKYPFPAEYKFTQEQVERNVEKIFGTYLEDHPHPLLNKTK